MGQLEFCPSGWLKPAVPVTEAAQLPQGLWSQGPKVTVWMAAPRQGTEAEGSGHTARSLDTAVPFQTVLNLCAPSCHVGIMRFHKYH